MSPPMMTPRTSTPAGAGHNICWITSSAAMLASVDAVGDDAQAAILCHVSRLGVSTATVIVPPVDSGANLTTGQA